MTALHVAAAALGAASALAGLWLLLTSRRAASRPSERRWALVAVIAGTAAAIVALG